jgi:hypothetical protein
MSMRRADFAQLLIRATKWVGGSNGDPNTLYFSDGINGEAHGLFGAIFANGNGS